MYEPLPVSILMLFKSVGVLVEGPFFPVIEINNISN